MNEQAQAGPPPGDGSGLWFTFGTIGFIVGIFFLNMLSRLGLAPLMPEVERELSLSHTRAGTMFLFISLGYGLGMFFSTFLSARLSHHRQIVVSSSAVGLALLLIARISHPGALSAALLVLGVSGGLYLGSGVAALTSLVQRKNWGKALAVHQLAPNLAYVVAPLAANFFLARYSWRTAFEVYGAASIVLGLIFLCRREVGGFHGQAPSLALFKGLFTDRAIWTLILLFGLSLGVNQGVFAMLPLYLSAERGLDHDWANSLLSLSRAAAFAAPLAAGWVSDRYGLKKTLLVVVSASGLTLLFLALAPSSWLGPALVLQAISCVCFFPLGFVALSQITRPEVRNVAVAVTVPFGHLIGAGLVPTIIGLAGDHGSFTLGLVALGALNLAGLGLLKRLRLDDPAAPAV